MVSEPRGVPALTPEEGDDDSEGEPTGDFPLRISMTSSNSGLPEMLAGSRVFINVTAHGGEELGEQFCGEKVDGVAQFVPGQTDVFDLVFRGSADLLPVEAIRVRFAGVGASQWALAQVTVAHVASGSQWTFACNHLHFNDHVTVREFTPPQAPPPAAAEEPPTAPTAETVAPSQADAADGGGNQTSPPQADKAGGDANQTTSPQPEAADGGADPTGRTSPTGTGKSPRAAPFRSSRLAQLHQSATTSGAKFLAPLPKTTIPSVPSLSTTPTLPGIGQAASITSAPSETNHEHASVPPTDRTGAGVESEDGGDTGRSSKFRAVALAGVAVSTLTEQAESSSESSSSEEETTARGREGVSLARRNSHSRGSFAPLQVDVHSNSRRHDHAPTNNPSKTPGSNIRSAASRLRSTDESPPPSSAYNFSQGGASNPSEPTVYLVDVVTGDMAGSSVDGNKVRISVTLYGEHGESDRLPLTKPTSRHAVPFRRAQKDTFNCFNPSGFLGTLTKLRLDFESKKVDRWFLSMISIRAKGGSECTRFVCNHWLSCRNGSYVELDPNPGLDNIYYTVAITTGRVMGADTDANVFITIIGDLGSTEELALDRVSSVEDVPVKWKRGSLNVFRVNSIDVGNVRSIRLGHDKSGLSSGWFVESATVAADTSLVVFEFLIFKWFDEERGNEQECLPLRSVLKESGPPDTPTSEDEDKAISADLLVEQGPTFLCVLEAVSAFKDNWAHIQNVLLVVRDVQKDADSRHIANIYFNSRKGNIFQIECDDGEGVFHVIASTRGRRVPKKTSEYSKVMGVQTQVEIDEQGIITQTMCDQAVEIPSAGEWMNAGMGLSTDLLGSLAKFASSSIAAADVASVLPVANESVFDLRSYRHTRLIPGKAYRYRLRELTAEFKGRDQFSDFGPFAVLKLESCVSPCHGGERCGESTLLMWDPPQSEIPVLQYELQRSENASGPFRAVYVGPETEFVAFGLEHFKDYYFRVKVSFSKDNYEVSSVMALKSTFSSVAPCRPSKPRLTKMQLPSEKGVTHDPEHNSAQQFALRVFWEYPEQRRYKSEIEEQILMWTVDDPALFKQLLADPRVNEEWWVNELAFRQWQYDETHKDEKKTKKKKRVLAQPSTEDEPEPIRVVESDEFMWVSVKLAGNARSFMHRLFVMFPSVTYRFRVQALNSTGPGPESLVASHTEPGEFVFPNLTHSTFWVVDPATINDAGFVLRKEMEKACKADKSEKLLGVLLFVGPDAQDPLADISAVDREAESRRGSTGSPLHVEVNMDGEEAAGVEEATSDKYFSALTHMLTRGIAAAVSKNSFLMVTDGSNNKVAAVLTEASARGSYKTPDSNLTSRARNVGFMSWQRTDLQNYIRSEDENAKDGNTVVMAEINKRRARDQKPPCVVDDHIHYFVFPKFKPNEVAKNLSMVEDNVKNAMKVGVYDQVSRLRSDFCLVMQAELQSAVDESRAELVEEDVEGADAADDADVEQTIGTRIASVKESISTAIRTCREIDIMDQEAMLAQIAGEEGGASNSSEFRVAVVTVISGCGCKPGCQCMEYKIARVTATRAVENSWPLIVLKSSGGLADEIAKYSEEWEKEPDVLMQTDAAVATIVEKGNVNIIDIMEDNPRDVARQISFFASERPSSSNFVLKDCWTRYWLYLHNAFLQVKVANRLKYIALFVQITITIFATVQALGKEQQWPCMSQGDTCEHGIQLWIVTAVLPIFLSTIVAVDTRLSPQAKYTALMSAAYAIKSEIYRYRARVGKEYKNEKTATSKLSERVMKYSGDLMNGAISVSHLKPTPHVCFKKHLHGIRVCNPLVPQEVLQARLKRNLALKITDFNTLFEATWIHPEDDGLSLLSITEYMTARLVPHHRYFGQKTKSLQNRMQGLTWMVYIFGGLSTVLSMVGLDTFIVLTTAFVSMFTALMDYWQSEQKLMRANQGLTELNNLSNWWNSLHPGEMLKQSSQDKLVQACEDAISQELGWVKSNLDTGDEGEEGGNKKKKQGEGEEEDEEGGAGGGDGTKGPGSAAPPSAAPYTGDKPPTSAESTLPTRRASRMTRVHPADQG